MSATRSTCSTPGQRGHRQSEPAHPGGCVDERPAFAPNGLLITDLHPEGAAALRHDRGWAESAPPPADKGECPAPYWGSGSAHGFSAWHRGRVVRALDAQLGLFLDHGRMAPARRPSWRRRRTWRARMEAEPGALLRDASPRAPGPRPRRARPLRGAGDRGPGLRFQCRRAAWPRRRPPPFRAPETSCSRARATAPAAMRWRRSPATAGQGRHHRGHRVSARVRGAALRPSGR